MAKGKKKEKKIKEKYDMHEAKEMKGRDVKVKMPMNKASARSR